MLNVYCTQKEDSSLDFSVYRKPSHTNQYLAFDSNHPLQHKFGHGSHPQAQERMIKKDKGNFGKEIQHIMQSLPISGYRDWAIYSELRQKE